MPETTTPLIIIADPNTGYADDYRRWDNPNTGYADDNRWWDKVMDWKEAKNQILFSLPMILTNVAYYLIPLASVMFAGHIGEVELAASNLANSWATVTGFSFMVSSCFFSQFIIHGS